MKTILRLTRFILLCCLAEPAVIHAAGTVGLGIGTSASLTNCNVGDLVQFTINMTNIGFSPASGITGTDIIPAGFQFKTWTSSPTGSASPVYNPTNGQWTLSSLAAGASAQISISTIASNGGIYTNTAQYTAPVTNGASVVVTVGTPAVAADLAVTLTASTNSVVVSQTVVFNLILQNLGPGNVLTNLAATVCLPTGFQYMTDSTVGGGSPGTYNASSCLWTIPVGLAANATASLSITARAANAGTYTTSASVAVPAGFTDSNPANNSSSVGVNVTASTTPINLSCSPNITVAAEGPNGVPSVFYTNAVSGGCGALTVSSTPSSGSIFPIGTNVVNCTASDSCGDQASCAFLVIVKPPPLTLVCSPNLTIAATSSNGAIVTFYTSVVGGCNQPSVVCNPPSGSLFPVGPTTVSCTATDSYGQQTNATFKVTVTPPSPSVPTTITAFNYNTNSNLLHLQWASAAGKIYTVEQSVDLVSWQNFVEGISSGGTVTTNQSTVNTPVSSSFFRIREDAPPAPFPSDPIISVGEGSFEGSDGAEFDPTLPFILAAQQYYIAQLTPTPAQYSVQSTITNSVSDQVLANALFIDWLIATNAVTVSTPEGLLAKNDALRWYYLTRMAASPLLPSTNGTWARGIAPSIATNLEASGISVFVAAETPAAKQSYTNSCATNGVPIPPDMFTGSWVNLGQITDPFISRDLYAELWIYVSQNPPGVCLALPRYITGGAAAPATNASIELLGLICLGFKAQTNGSCYACFWDNPAGNRASGKTPPVNGYWVRGVARPIGDFVGGPALNAPGQIAGGQCSDCHAGQNSFIVHPNRAAFASAYTKVGAAGIPGHGATLNGDSWYIPMVDASWTQNPNPGTDQGGDCTKCHELDSKAGRIPAIYDMVPGYCGDVLPTATKTDFNYTTETVFAGVAPAKPTMPPAKPGKPNFDDMKQLYLQCMKPLAVKAALAPNPFPALASVVSAPGVVGPLYATATKIAVQGTLLGANVTLYTNGIAAGTVTNARNPSQIEFTISPLLTGESVTVSQTLSGASNTSSATVVQNYFTNSPGYMPPPSLDEFTIYQGASVIEAVNEAGVMLTILRNGVQVAQVVTSSGVTIIPLTNGTPFQTGDVFQAYETLGGITSSNSDSVSVIPPPTTLPTPTLDTVQTYPGQEMIRIKGLVNGALTSVLVNNTVVGHFSSPTPTAQFDLTTSTLGRPLQPGDQLALSQSFGGTNLSGLSTNLPPTSSACNSLPAPAIQTPVEGINSVNITQSLSGAQILVFDSTGAQLGKGSGSTINLSRLLVCGDILSVVQQMGGCTSTNAYRVTVGP